VLVIVGADDVAAVTAALEEIKAALPARGAAVVYEELGRVFPDSPEHFGFRDGISTVAPRGRLSDGARHYLSRRYVDPGDPRALRFSKPGQALVWPGQFVFGYPRQAGGDPVAAGPIRDGGAAWLRNGSLLVFRRLRQDVPAFRRFVAAEASRLAGISGFGHITQPVLAAMLVGRWPNGTSLTIKPNAPARSPMNDRLRVNHFGYASATPPIGVSADRYIKTEEGFVAGGDAEMRAVPGARGDPDGVRCPKFAHVRKVNPRDLVTDLGPSTETLTLQVLRRGITFGTQYDGDGTGAGAADDGDRGLLFLCYQTSIADQFERMTIKWMNRPLGPEGDAGHDLLVGQSHGASGARAATLRSPDGDETTITADADWVIPTGGGYFLSPSLSTLRSLAGV
jgi:Dyp-type peroxidase family